MFTLTAKLQIHERTSSTDLHRGFLHRQDQVQIGHQIAGDLSQHTFPDVLLDFEVAAGSEG